MLVIQVRLSASSSSSKLKPVFSPPSRFGMRHRNPGAKDDVISQIIDVFNHSLDVLLGYTAISQQPNPPIRTASRQSAARFLRQMRWGSISCAKAGWIFTFDCQQFLQSQFKFQRFFYFTAGLDHLQNFLDHEYLSFFTAWRLAGSILRKKMLNSLIFFSFKNGWMAMVFTPSILSGTVVTTSRLRP